MNALTSACAYVSQQGAARNARLSVVVKARSEEADHVCSFDLRRADGGTLPEFSAGAHIDLYLPNGMVRQYSLCNPPGETGRYLIAILKEPQSRGGSRWVHEELVVGQSLEISYPRNNFALTPAATGYLLFAGGIGITPILAMAQDLNAQGVPFQLFYFSRSPAAMAFRAQLQASQYRDHVHFHFDSGEDAISIDEALELIPGAHVYVCGPDGFIRVVGERAVALGVAEERIVIERFAANVVKGETNFTVLLQRSGTQVTVGPSISIVDAVRSAGVEIPTSCQQGVCGTCLTPVLSGIPDHRDMYLTDEEKSRNDQMLPCCSRSKSELLVLDL